MIRKIQEHIKPAQIRQKSYADKRERLLEFQVGDKLFLKVSPVKGVRRFNLSFENMFQTQIISS